MELQLRNFRHYRKADVRFKLGVTLLNGDSGAGKTTILEAFDYVLYGKLRGQYTHGETTCSVKFILSPTVWIQRNSGPGKLVLMVNEQKYEGEAAQSIINQMYGEREIFLASCYSKQGERCPLISGTNAEKMALIRAISFHADDVELAQEKIKTALKEVQSKIKEHETAFTLATRILQNFDNENPNIVNSKLDLTTVNVDDVDKQVASETENIKVKTVELHEILRLEAEISTLSKILESSSSSIDRDAALKRIIEIENSIIEIAKQVEDLRQQEAKIAALKAVKASQTKHIELVKSLEAEIAKLSDSFVLLPNETYEGEIERISKNIAIQSKLNEILASHNVANVGELRKSSSDMASEIRSLRMTLTEFEKDLESKKWNDEQSRILVCPKCSASLQLEAGCLKLHGDSKVELRPLTNPQISETMVKSKRADVERAVAKREKLETSVASYNALYREQVREKDGDQSKIDGIRKLLNLKIRLNDLKTSNVDVQSEVNFEQVDPNAVQNLIGQKSSLEAERNSLQNAVRDYDKNVKIRGDFETLKLKLGERKSEILNVEITNSNNEIKQLKIIKDICLKTLKRTELLANRNSKKEHLDAFAGKAQNLTKLLELARQTEIKVLDHSVARLNAEMKTFLDVMFPDTSITVAFSMTRDSKSKDSKSMTCSLLIYYRNVEYSNPKDLSGGEGDRVSLAMTLALNSMLGSNMILLDETLNTVDKNMKMKIVEIIKNIVGNEKIAVIISHEGVEGVYDSIISL